MWVQKGASGLGCHSSQMRRPQPNRTSDAGSYILGQKDRAQESSLSLVVFSKSATSASTIPHSRSQTGDNVTFIQVASKQARG